MKTSEPTLPFYIELKDGTTMTRDAESLEHLREVAFSTPAEFEEKAAKVSWKEKTTLSTFNVATGEVSRKIADGDVNPFGWRQQHR